MNSFVNCVYDYLLGATATHLGRDSHIVCLFFLLLVSYECIQ